MEYISLGRTGLNVSVAGLGAGGHSRLGLSSGHSTEQATDVVRTAIDEGVNLIDTARVYRTESVIGTAIKGRARDSLVLCTKVPVRRKGELIEPESIRSEVDASLRELGTDRIDVLYLHGVLIEDYAFSAARCLPVLEKLKQSGKIRFTGITEFFSGDTTHRMLSRATCDPDWDVIMVGFNLLNPSARKTVLPQAMEQEIGTTVMFAVRRALSRPEALRETLDRLVAEGHDDLADLDREDPLGFLIRPDGAESLTDAAYRFARHEPGMNCVLFGTGSPEHVRQNVASITRPPLPEKDLARLKLLFGAVDSESGN
jgi:L-galactose dehydrogenase